MKCKAKKAFFAGKNDIYHRWKEVKNLNGKVKNDLLSIISELSTIAKKI